MPALIVTGRPRVGKTTFVNLVAKRALDNAEKYNISQVVIINEETACQSTKSSNIQSDTTDPNSNGKILNYRQYYPNSHVEKSTRAALKAEFDRRQSRSGTLVLLDSLNYIKGYRYELYCISKASGDKHGVVWVKSDELDTASNGWHRSCPSIDSTASATTRTATTQTEEEEDLIIHGLNLRFESPDERNRWENPLYIVNMGGSTKNGELQQTVDEILDSFLLKVKALKTGLSTQKPLPAASNVLHEVDNITQRLSDLIVTEVQKPTFFAGSTIKIPTRVENPAQGARKPNNDTNITVCIQKNTLNLPEMRRLRRQYMQWISNHPPDTYSELGITQNFCSYVETNLR